MPARILRSTTAGNVPTSLVSGQIAINEADGKLFYRAAPSGTVTQLSVGGLTDGNKGDLTVSGNSWTINAGAVVTADLADEAVTTAKIANSAVTLAKTSGIQKAITSGTAAPTGGTDGDIYLQYT